MGGDIRVESQVGQGTTFFLDLPLTPGSSRLSAPEEKKEILKSDMCQTILIAEDDDSNLFYIQTLLRKTRLVIFKAKNGKEAVDLCLTHPEISLVLMDMKMPVMDGQEATRLIKMQRPDVVIIAVTAFGMSGDEQRFLDAGCDDYLPKPIKKEEFFSKLSAHGIILPG
jgi:CheY-like chemotaxis protein